MPEIKFFNEKEIEKIEVMAGLGLTTEQMAAILGVSKKTFERRCYGPNEQPGVSDALIKGRAKASYRVMQTAFGMATSGKHPVMTMFWLKCREHWKDNSPGLDDQVIELKYSVTKKAGEVIEEAQVNKKDTTPLEVTTAPDTSTNK